MTQNPPHPSIEDDMDFHQPSMSNQPASTHVPPINAQGGVHNSGTSTGAPASGMAATSGFPGKQHPTGAQTNNAPANTGFHTTAPLNWMHGQFPPDIQAIVGALPFASAPAGTGNHGGPAGQAPPGNPPANSAGHQPSYFYPGMAGDLNALMSSVFSFNLPPGPTPPPNNQPIYQLTPYAAAPPIYTVPPPVSEFATVCCKRHKPNRPRYKLPKHINFKDFPPEIREHIYDYILPDSFGVSMPPFIVALRAAEPTLYHEALAFFSKHNTFRLSSENTWASHDMGQTAIKSIKKLSIEFCGLLVRGHMQLYPMIGPDNRILKPFDPKEIHLDATYVSWDLIPLPAMLAAPCVSLYKNLERLLVTIPHPNVILQPEDLQMWEDDYEEIKWRHQCIQDSIRFLNSVLGIKGKLWSVSVGNPDTWYWEARKGQKLVWNKEKEMKMMKKAKIRRMAGVDPDDISTAMLDQALHYHWHGDMGHVHGPFLGGQHNTQWAGPIGSPTIGPSQPPVAAAASPSNLNSGGPNLNSAQVGGSGSTAASSATAPSNLSAAGLGSSTAAGTTTLMPGISNSTAGANAPGPSAVLGTGTTTSNHEMGHDQSANEWETESEFDESEYNYEDGVQYGDYDDEIDRLTMQGLDDGDFLAHMLNIDASSFDNLYN